MTTSTKRSTGDYLPASDPLSVSLDFIEELSKTGIILTPLKPTDLMVSRGASAGNITAEQAKAVYFAMIALSS
ncbi:MAG: hypothetical protein ISR45_11800 [Rhodospirillales bacterium]|nr:hypothetical protein [Rhodospirillales bacterium]